MYSTHNGHLLDLFGPKIKLLLLLLLIGFSGQIHAQRSHSFNYESFSSKAYYFGITLGYNTSRYHIQHDESFILNDTVRVLESVRGPGFNLGIVTNIKFGKNFDLRLNLPTLSFAERELQYVLPSQEIVSRKIESVFIDFPFQIRYKSKPYNDVRAFVVFGAKYSLDLASNSRARQAEDLIRIEPNDFQLEYGVGLQFFFPYFILSPEIKFSHGLNNIHNRNDALIYSSVIEKLFARTLTISFHFEG
jgi:hypothetical protein